MPTFATPHPTPRPGEAMLRRAWQRYYESRGVASLRAGFLAADKARRGRKVPS